MNAMLTGGPPAEGADQRRGQAGRGAHRTVEGVDPLPQEHGADEQTRDDKEDADTEHPPDRHGSASAFGGAQLVGPDGRIERGAELLAPGPGVHPSLAEPLLAGDGRLETTGARRRARLGATPWKKGHQWPVNLRRDSCDLAAEGYRLGYRAACIAG